MPARKSAPGAACRACAADAAAGRVACTQCGSEFYACCNVPVRPPPSRGRSHARLVPDVEVEEAMPGAVTASRALPQRTRHPSPSVAQKWARQASSIGALPDEHFTRVPPWRRMGLTIDIEKKAPRRPEAAYQPPGAHAPDGQPEPVAGPAVRRAPARSTNLNQMSKRGRGRRDEQEADRRRAKEAPGERGAAERGAGGTGRAGQAGESLLRLSPHKPEQAQTQDSAQPGEPKNARVGAQSPGLERMLARMDVREQSSSDETANLDAPGPRSSSDDDMKEASVCNEVGANGPPGAVDADVALTVLPEEDEANGRAASGAGDAQAGEPSSCCRDRLFVVALQSTSIAVWVCAASITLPAVAFWTVLILLLIVHIIEAYYCESLAHLRTVMSHRRAASLLRVLRAAQPALVFHLGEATTRLKFSRWDDSSPDQPALAQDGVVLLKVVSEFSVHDTAALEAQMSAFRTVQCRGPSDAMQQQLVIEGFSDYTHSGTRSTPVMRVLVSPEGKAHPLANVWCFWLCHISVVLALPYRWWLLSTSRCVTHVVSKRFVCF